MSVTIRATPAWKAIGRAGDAERSDFLKALLRRYKLLVGCILLGIAGAGAALWWLPASYTARAVMRVDVDDIDAVDPQSALASTRELELRRDHQIETQLQLLNSRPLMRKVVQNLALYDDSEFNPGHAQVAAPPAKSTAGPAKQPQISPLVIEAVTNQLNDAVKIAQDGTTEFINIDVSSSSPGKAARIANKIASTYVETQVAEKRATNQRAIEALQRQVADLHDQLLSGERNTADYKRTHRLDGTDLAGSAALRISQVAGDLATAQGERAEAQARVGYGVNSMSSPLLNDLRAQETAVRQKLADLSTSFGSGHPEVQKTRAQLMELERSITIETARARQALVTDLTAQQARERQLAAQLNALQSRSLNDLITAVPLADMDRSSDATRAIYVALLGRLDTLVRENELVRPDSTLVFAALPPSGASSPKAGRILVASIAGAVLVGLLMIVILEQIDTTVRTPRQVWSIARLPTLGMLPELRKRRRSQLNSPARIDQPYSAFSEEVRSVFAKATRLLPGSGSGVILITSPQPHDGKTTLSLALAAAAVAVDRTVILLDLDLRRPSMAASLGLDRERPDLLSYIAGDAQLSEVMQGCPQVPLLRVVAPFQAAGDPLALLMSSRLAEMIGEMRNAAQLVIINTPPALAVADAATLARLSDLSLLVLYWGRTTEETLRGAVAEFGDEITGVIFNHVDPSHSSRAAYENYAYHRDSGRLRQFALTRRRVDRALATAAPSSLGDGPPGGS